MADDLLHLEGMCAEVYSSVRPVFAGERCTITARPGVHLHRGSAPAIDPDREQTLEDVTLEITSATTPFVVGLGATAYLHPGVHALAVVDGGAALLAPGAVVDEVDPEHLSAGRITVADWQHAGQRR